MKQAIVIRTDIKMSKGKIAVQTAHASVSVLDKISKTKLNQWKKEGQKKIVLKVKTLEDIVQLKNKCDELNIPCALVADAGLTEVEPGTITVLAIGPDEDSKINKVTGNLKIL
jgi:PTH2 family peptidyl-tRNA hydrolase